MTPDPVLDVGAIDRLLYPDHWLVIGLEWPGGPVAEAALAIAPDMIPRSALSTAAAHVLWHADRYAHDHSMCVVFFADLTLRLTAFGTS